MDRVLELFFSNFCNFQGKKKEILIDKALCKKIFSSIVRNSSSLLYITKTHIVTGKFTGPKWQ